MAATRLLLRGLALALAASPAASARADDAPAETLRLRSGAVYEAESVEVRGETLVLRMQVGAGAGRASFPFARVEPADLLRILAARTPGDDALGQARLARIALEAGRPAEAVERAARAAALDPALGAIVAEVRDAVLAAEADAALAEIEHDLRAGRPLAARERARLLLETGVPVSPPEPQAARARVLLELADALATALAAAKPALVLPTPAPAAEPLPPAPPAPAAPGTALADADALAARGLLARDEAADPAMPAPRREQRLLAAAEDLLHARRLLQALAQSPEVVPRLDGLRGWLVATWLDLADLARSAGQRLMALDRVQAALVLEPENERAWELRRWIEGDLAGPSFVVVEPPVSFYGSWFSSGWYAPGPSWGGCCPGPYARGYRGHGHGGHAGGARHNPGRRR